MMKLFLYALMLGGFFICSGCAKENATNAYVGDGELVYLEKPGLFGSEGWEVIFDEFPLTKEYGGTYSFRGLPSVKKADHYTAYLYIPSSLEKSAFNEAILKMALYANGEMVSELTDSMGDWICTGYYLRSGVNTGGDGMEKSYYKFGLGIPVDPSVQYELRVHYIPSNEVDGDETGHFYLRIGGSK